MFDCIVHLTYWLEMFHNACICKKERYFDEKDLYDEKSYPFRKFDEE